MIMRLVNRVFGVPSASTEAQPTFCVADAVAALSADVDPETPETRPARDAVLENEDLLRLVIALAPSGGRDAFVSFQSLSLLGLVCKRWSAVVFDARSTRQTDLWASVVTNEYALPAFSSAPPIYGGLRRTTFLKIGVRLMISRQRGSYLGGVDTTFRHVPAQTTVADVLRQSLLEADRHLGLFLLNGPHVSVLAEGRVNPFEPRVNPALLKVTWMRGVADTTTKWVCEVNFSALRARADSRSIFRRPSALGEGEMDGMAMISWVFGPDFAEAGPLLGVSLNSSAFPTVAEAPVFSKLFRYNDLCLYGITAPYSPGIVDADGICLNRRLCFLSYRHEIKHINVSVREHDGTCVFFRVKGRTVLYKVMVAFCQRQGVPLVTRRFLFDGRPVSGQQTAGGIGLFDGAVVDAELIPLA